MTRCMKLMGLMLVLTISACTTTPRLRGGVELQAPVPLHPSSDLQTLHLVGKASGPLGGLGPGAQVEVWLRADAKLRADLRYQGEDDSDQHEVLLWTDDSALLIDLVGGRLADLSDEPGMVDIFGIQLDLDAAISLLTGTHLRGRLEAVEWLRGSEQWRWRQGPLSLRRSDYEPPDGVEARWVDDDHNVHSLTVGLSDHILTPWGPIPSKLGVDGTDLAAHLKLNWSQIEVFPAMGDSILDPSWEPGSR